MSYILNGRVALTSAETARPPYLDIAEGSLRNIRASGRPHIPHVKVGPTCLYFEDDVLEYIATGQPVRHSAGVEAWKAASRSTSTQPVVDRA